MGDRLSTLVSSFIQLVGARYIVPRSPKKKEKRKNERIAFGLRKKEREGKERRKN